MIKKSGTRWIVYSKDGKRKLATCFSKEEAEEMMRVLMRNQEFYKGKQREEYASDSD